MCLLRVTESKHAKHTSKSFKYARSIPQPFLDHHNLKLLKPLFEKGDGPEDKNE